jgi:hypothetical protein
MKKLYFLFIILISTASFGQTLITENFDYGVTAGDLVTQSGGIWSQHSGSSPTVDYATSPLTMASYPSSGIGGSATIVSPGSQDVNRSFTAINSGTVYASALVNFSAISSGNYFIHFNSSSFKARVGAKDDGNGQIRFGISGNSSTLNYGASLYDLNTTYLVVFSYAYDTGLCNLYVLTAPTGTEPGTVESTDTSGETQEISAIAIRQTSGVPTGTIDGIRVATAWTDLMNDSTNPTLLISDGPANGSSIVESPEIVDNATIDFTTTNFIMSDDSGSCVSDGSGEGYIKWDMEDTGTNTIVDSGCIFTSNGPPEYPVTGLSTGNTYLLTAWLVDNNGDAFTPDATYTLTLTIVNYTDVADLATLRASTVSDEIFYRVTGEVINTYSRDTRNQIYFQDATGGILVDDEENEVGTVYAEGDGVENIRGHLSTVSGVLQFIPTYSDWGPATSTANDITPEVVTVSTLLSSWESYESELVRINGVTFTDAGGSFSSSTSYDISDSSSMTFRTNFSEANYIGGVIPSGSNDIIVLVGEYFGTPQVTAKSMNDLTLSIGRTEIEGFAIYPNPVSNGEFSIRTNGGVSKSVQIFDMLGKQVYSKEVQANENVKISNLNTGIYILKVQEEGRLATRKLVVQ